MSDTKLPRQFLCPAVEFWYIFQCIKHCQRGWVVWKEWQSQNGPGTDFGHPWQSNPWCDPTNPLGMTPGVVWLQLGVSKTSPYRSLTVPQGHTRGLQPLNCHSLLQPLWFHLVSKARAHQSLGSVRYTQPSAVPAQSCPPGPFLIAMGRSLRSFSLGNACVYLLLKLASCYSSLSPNGAIRPQVHRSSFSIPCHHKPIDTRNLYAQ